MVARRAHNPEVAGSSPVSATKEKTLTILVGVFLLLRKYDFTATDGSRRGMSRPRSFK